MEIKEIQTALNGMLAEAKTDDITSFTDGVVTTCENILSYLERDDFSHRFNSDFDYHVENFCGSNFQYGCDKVFAAVERLL